MNFNSGLLIKIPSILGNCDFKNNNNTNNEDDYIDIESPKCSTDVYNKKLNVILVDDLENIPIQRSISYKNSGNNLHKYTPSPSFINERKISISEKNESVKNLFEEIKEDETKKDQKNIDNNTTEEECEEDEEDEEDEKRNKQFIEIKDKDELNMEQKIATESGLVKMGEALAEKNMRERRIKKIREELDRCNNVEEIIDEEIMKYINEGDDSLEECIIYILQNKTNEFEILRKVSKHRMIELMIKYMYLKMDNEKLEKDLEELKEYEEEKDEQINNYIEEIDELENKLEENNKKIDESIKDRDRFENLLNCNIKNMEINRKYENYEFFLYMIFTNLLQFSIHFNGLFFHFKILKMILYSIIDFIGILIFLIYSTTMDCFDFINKYRLMNYMIFIFAMMFIYEKTGNMREYLYKKIEMNIIKLNKFNKLNKLNKNEIKKKLD